ncbi:MAG TPA: methylated-DNA--[protein]-cysteine S-methyltransferase [Streptosporangiaceae bacterium]|jgi:methylated-DNA-[protein]-cysteine S-methyltransferase
MPGHAEPILATVLDTPAGALSLLTSGGTLVAGGFTGDPSQMYARLHHPAATGPLEAARPEDLPWLVKPVRAYFDGDLAALDALPVHQHGTPLRQRLWQRMRDIPAGATLTYTQLAAEVGLPPGAARVAGAACAANLIAPVVPCHRVLRTDGGLGGYYYGLPCKRWLLAHEGATV